VPNVKYNLLDSFEKLLAGIDYSHPVIVCEFLGVSKSPLVQGAYVKSSNPGHAVFLLYVANGNIYI
jgi:hypothetical protein